MKFINSCLSIFLLSTSTNTHHGGADAFSLQMKSTDGLAVTTTSLSSHSSSSTGGFFPPPLRAMASPPPVSSASSTSLPRFASPPKSIVSLRLASPSTTIESETTISNDSTKTPTSSPPSSKPKTLALITFDLDDSLYPISPVLSDANKIFVQIMAQYGYTNIDPQDIVETCSRIRDEAGPIAGTAMSHTEVRMEAIRREMEKKMLERKLMECAENWATEVESLTDTIRKSAEKWAKTSVSQSVVESIYSAWERERHHSAERHLYPEILPVLETIKSRHPNAIIGAVTDGKANPKLMVFSLAPYFDYCMSWEDDGEGRMEFFKELGNVDGNADLEWIYRAAYEKYGEMAESGREIMKAKGGVVADEEEEEPVWIHVGDDLAYDVGGSASCGAKTILLDLDEEYGQTAKMRFLEGDKATIPSWNTASDLEIVNHKAMNNAAEGMVDKRISRLTLLPDAVDEILKGE